MAEAFGNMQGKGIFNSFSSGSKPSGQVNQKAIASMKKIGYNMSTHISKSLDDIPQVTYDYVITMGCGDDCPFVKAKTRIDWKIPDPKHLEMTQFNAVRDTIKEKVISLVKEIKAST